MTTKITPEIKNIVSKIADVLFPPICLSCRKRLRFPSFFSNEICDNCANQIEIHNSFFCPKCQSRLPEARNTCHPETHYILGSASSYSNEQIRELIHSLKYMRYEKAADLLGFIACEYLNRIIDNQKINLQNFTLLPIPLHISRERKRGFNQSLLIAKAISIHLKENKICEIDINQTILKRVLNTKSQTECKNQKDRAQNIVHGFDVNEKRLVDGNSFILIDDVFTSGATMNEAVKTLKNYGAKKIIALVIAKA